MLTGNAAIDGAVMTPGPLCRASLLVLLVACDRSPPSVGAVPSGAAAASESPRVVAAASAKPTPSAAASARPVCDTACNSLERCVLEGTKSVCAPACPEGEVYIPATPPTGFKLGTGTVLYGFGKFTQSRKGLREGDAKHTVVLSMPFCLDAHEVTAAKWESCVSAGKCERPGTRTQWGTYQKHPDKPVNMVDHAMAAAYCRDRGQELPTEAQWFWAATGGEPHLYPWGDEHPTCEHADFTAGSIPTPAGDFGCRGGGPSPVGSMPKGDKIWPNGHVHELAGNVWEWVLDPYVPYTSETQTDPLPTRGIGMYAIRGGGWNRSHLALQVTFRGGEPIDYKVPGLGFRCARNPTEHRVLRDRIAELTRSEAQFTKLHPKR